MIDTTGPVAASSLTEEEAKVLPDYVLNKLDEELREMALNDDSVYNLHDFSFYPDKMTS